MIFLNLFLGTLVNAVGFWLIWGGTVSPVLVIGWALIVGLFLWFMMESITELWAWSTLLLGLESFAWPLVLMIQLKGQTESLPESEMGTILSAVVLGLVSSVFWMSFAYGLFKRARKLAGAGRAEQTATEPISRAKKKRNRI
ncbi:MAG: hypothetical protein CV081_00105 [Nitrospira sp. LK265]|nr:hypothetical protein [Nitrospira sp.]NGZ58891.1 hypothetical protein [Nitrospira sp. LK265]